MTTGPSNSLLVFQLSDQRFALPVGDVQEVARAVEIAPLPDAPRGVLGIINVRGRIVPVFECWSRLGETVRAVRIDDHFIVARTLRRVVALLVDTVEGVVTPQGAQWTSAAEILPGAEWIAGVVKLEGGLALVYDLERFLSAEEDEKLRLALASAT